MKALQTKFVERAKNIIDMSEDENQAVALVRKATTNKETGAVKAEVELMLVHALLFVAQQRGVNELGTAELILVDQDRRIDRYGEKAFSLSEKQLETVIRTAFKVKGMAAV